MKILMISEFFPDSRDLKFSGGVEARAYYIAKELAKNNKVSVITSWLPNTKKHEEMNNVQVYRVAKRNYQANAGDIFSRLRFVKRSINIANKIDADIVEGSNFVTHFIAKQIAKNKKIPVVAWYPDVWVGKWVKNTGLVGIFGEFLERVNLARGFDAYIAISKSTAKKLSPHAKKHINIIYCGVNKSEFNTIQKIIPSTIITSSARFTKYKNVETIILAFAHLSTKIKKSKLVLIGNGPTKSKMIGLVKRLNLESKVQFKSDLPRKEFLKCLSSSQIFILASLVEGFGITTIEACASGLPYVISNIAVHKEITKNGTGGFLVSPQKPLDYSKKLFALITDKRLYAKKSKEALLLSDEYNWAKLAIQTEAVYKRLL